MADRLHDLLELIRPELEALPDLPQDVLRPKIATVTNDKTTATTLQNSGGVSQQQQDAAVNNSEICKQIKVERQEKRFVGEAKPEQDSTSHKLQGDSRYIWPTDVSRDKERESLDRSGQRSDKSPQAAAAIRQKDENRPRVGAKLSRGDVGSSGHSYCPIISVSKFPYKYISGSDSQRVAERFFDQGKFWQRGWELFTVEHPGDNERLVLIPDYQMMDLLDEINQVFDLDLRITEWHREIGLAIKFPPFEETLPRFLGVSTSREHFNDLTNQTNLMKYCYNGQPTVRGPHASPEDVELFKKIIEDGIQLNKTKKKAERQRKREEVVLRNRKLGQELKRAQRYLGLRPKKDSNVKSAAQSTDPGTVNSTLSAVDVDELVPYAFELDPIIICIDVEAYERDHSKITEVGIATLDTDDIARVSPGEDGKNWFTKIRARHIRIKDYLHLENKEFVQGCADRFEFGDSEIVSLAGAAKVIQEAFSPPYSRSYEQLSAVANSNRNIIILGHDAETDIKFLHKLGFNPLNLPNQTVDANGTANPGLVEVLDTATMWRTYKREQNPTGLSKILAQLKIVGWNVHNAGNDAVYTLQVMIATCVRDAVERGELQREAKKLERAARLQTEIKERVEALEEDMRAHTEGWSGDEDDDGGAARKPVGQSSKRKE